MSGRVAVFGPNPMLSITVEALTAADRAAAGAANFLRNGLGSADRTTVEKLARRVELRPL